MMTATLIGCGQSPKFRGGDRSEITKKIADWLQEKYLETGDDAWLYAEASDGRGVFFVSIEG